MENKFKCKDEVIYRIPGGEWYYGIFSHYQSQGLCFKRAIINGNHYNLETVDILPYEGNEELVGTTNSPYGKNEVELEEGEIILASNNPNMLYDCIGFLERFKEVSGNKFVSNNCDKYDYIIRFSDFNPKDMEETEKHILCIKNGRIVRKNKS